ncbi:MAG: hypothetical protein EKK68_02715 [Candidatus Competibacteraceae bacterium]|nr:MAG: hypothetical protein EKK68_02715 [Candidatus Competibacteraceae bacterium]
MRGWTGVGEGRLHIQIGIEQGVIVKVALNSTRPVGMSDALTGCEPAAIINRLPRLFSLCGVAQAVAGLTAVETALGFTPPPPQTAARRFLVVAEALEQTAWQLLLEGPRCIGLTPAFERLKRLRSLIAKLCPQLFPDPIWNRIGGARLQPDQAGLATTLAEMGECLHPAIWGEPALGQPWQERRDFAHWLDQAATPIATLLRQVQDCGLADFGRCATTPLPTFDPEQLAQRLAGDDGQMFCARPDWEGVVYETGALARQWDEPLIAALRADHGNGLLTRWAARALESRALLAELREGLHTIVAQPGAAVDVTATGAGLGVVECARGRLAHWVALAAGQVSRYRILAPTEWNLHPDGPLFQGLIQARTGQDATIRHAATLLVTALDPCVGFDLTIDEGS